MLRNREEKRRQADLEQLERKKEAELTLARKKMAEEREKERPYQIQMIELDSQATPPRYHNSTVQFNSLQQLRTEML